MTEAEELKARISQLPRGSLSTKKVCGRIYHYHRISENGKRREQYVPETEVPALEEGIRERRRLEKQLRGLTVRESGKQSPDEWRCTVLSGSALIPFAAPVAGWKKRTCFTALQEFVSGAPQDKVLILCGLRRTGKTTLLRQLIAAMNEKERDRTAYVQLSVRQTLADLNQDLKRMQRLGIDTVLIDEVTLLSDFIDGSALLPDIFAASGMHIVLSGTNSLSFMLAKSGQLYDRCRMIHTTWIPFGEFARVLGIRDVDTYIRYGGTMTMSGTHYNPQNSAFRSLRTVDEYVNTAIADNIQHSLSCWQDGTHFRNLQDLHEQGELTGAVNRIIEDVNHRFTIEVLTRTFRSHDLAVSARNLRQDRTHPDDILDHIDERAVTDRLKEWLKIAEEEEMTVGIEQVHVQEIHEYLEVLDLIREVEVRSIPQSSRKRYRTLITQPGLRYAQASALIQALSEDPIIDALDLHDRESLKERILSEIQGRMLEDIVLLDTMARWPEKEVFVLQFALGEFDMVIFDPEKLQCEVFEIKHSKIHVRNQARHLTDPENCRKTEFRFGPITRRTVLYRGETCEEDGILYQNVEEYLTQPVTQRNEQPAAGHSAR
ncbi:AAA family ATPase [uncultured Faecalibaculum sp.]|uniref:AAA family ATPase n=1 Tax=uncultured Faecalibaculum sp. TaxID=1729681 RepID=UPI0025E694E3|nr:AAA family ATPase [uncultured Faecalibaculum sp.]